MAFNFLITGLSSNDIMVNYPKDSSVSTVINNLTCNDTDVLFVHNGSPIEDLSIPLELTSLEEQSHLVVIRAYHQVLGGKGGFGALIRAMGMRMNRNRNKDACRDLTGRRLRAVNAEKKVAELMKKEPERRKKEAKEKQEKRRLLLEGPRHQFNDTEYIEQLEATQDNLEDALKQGLMAGGNGRLGQSSVAKCQVKVTGKRKGIKNNEECSNKRQKIWLSENDADSDDCDSDISASKEDESEEIHLINDSSSPDIPILPVPIIHETPVINDSSIPSSTTREEDSKTINNDPSPEIQNQESSNSPTSVVNDAAIMNETTDNGDQSNVNPPQFLYEEFDVNNYETVEELMEIGGDGLKTVLQRKGLKCGGTLHERAIRLWSVKGKDITEIDPTLLAANKRSRNKGKKK